jgi:hypothetical protein
LLRQQSEELHTTYSQYVMEIEMMKISSPVIASVDEA